MNVSLTPRLEEFVRRKVASGLYNNASEVVREALRLLVEREGTAVEARFAQPPARQEVCARLAALEAPLRARGVTSLALFGSVLRGDAGPDSDIDVLVDIDPVVRFSLVDLVSLGSFLGERLGREVDVVTREGLDPTVRRAVLAEAESVF